MFGDIVIGDMLAKPGEPLSDPSLGERTRLPGLNLFSAGTRSSGDVAFLLWYPAARSSGVTSIFFLRVTLEQPKYFC